MKKALGKTNWYKNKKYTKLVGGEKRSFQGGAPILKDIKNCSKQARGKEKQARETEAVRKILGRMKGVNRRIASCVQDVTRSQEQAARKKESRTQ